jgi:hypothetical protein
MLPRARRAPFGRTRTTFEPGPTWAWEGARLDWTTRVPARACTRGGAEPGAYGCVWHRAGAAAMILSAALSRAEPEAAVGSPRNQEEPQ